MSNELREQVIKMYRYAFNKGTDAAWRTYKRKLNKLAKENDAASPEVLERWALDTF